ncbi:hypothetical protein LIR45_01280 [Lachnospiraceae bacterium EP-SM-12S-S03]|nr:hypothetical protein [Lachnospiraceae bacterium EP-SM-12S-S03]
MRSVLDYEHYLNKYDSYKIPEELFVQMVKKAERYLNQFTFGGIQEVSYDTEIKNCICEMAEVIYIEETKKSDGIKKSENIDGYSVTYVTEMLDGEDRKAVLQRQLYHIAERYLMHTGLLYLGV